MRGNAETRRTRGKNDRRDRILQEARLAIEQNGIDAVNLRDLADSAGVTVPTIYNLIGNKSDIFVALFTDILGELEIRLPAVRGAEPLAEIESLVIETAALFSSNEQYYRAAFIAVEYVNQLAPRPASVIELYAWGKTLLIGVVESCSRAGMLHGRITKTALGDLIRRSFLENLRDWTAGHASLDRFRRAALTDIYVTLAADATEFFHARLVKNITKINVESILKVGQDVTPKSNTTQEAFREP